jgi:hypothetical protein
MASKKGQKFKEGANPVAGYRSSFIASILALLVLLIPLLVANFIDISREGEGKYDFAEAMCFDIESETQFDEDFVFEDIPPSGTDSGTGAFAWYYFDTDDGFHSIMHDEVQVLSTPLNNTIDGYAVTTSKLREGTDTPGTSTSEMGFGMDFTKKKIIDLDITRVDIYLEINGASFDEMLFGFADTNGKVVAKHEIKLDNITKIDISVEDLLSINTLSSTKKLVMWFQAPSGEVLPSEKYIVFDMQWYCIDELKTPTLIKLGIYMSIAGLGLIFLGFIVSPEYTFQGVVDWLDRRTRGMMEDR